ncbi:MAG: aldolase/citrate lyase family protein, partial [Acidobacteriota bacterium]
MKDLKKRIRNGDTLLGCWLNMGSSVSAEIVGSAEFDWVLIDFEHGSGSEQEVLHQLQALEHSGAASIVRVESYQRQRIHRMLDFGAEGVMVPRIDTPEDAELAAKAIKYQPDGLRGVAKMNRASGYGTNFENYLKTEQHELVGVLQIETTESLNHLDKIAAVNGVDVLFIGPMDLSTALGVSGQWEHPLYLDAIEKTARAALQAGKAAGILLPTPDEFLKYFGLGYRFIACGSDIG